VADAVGVGVTVIVAEAAVALGTTVAIELKTVPELLRTFTVKVFPLQPSLPAFVPWR
jgi:hypothetical protein